ncbi:MAG: hypothetical protein AABX13_01375 [Nanoarchaeota archaeon]
MDKFNDRFNRSLSRSGAAYSLAVGLALGVAFSGCAPKDEGENENTIQRYNCAMNECLPDPNGPYAVSDCNNECGGAGNGDGGNGQQMDYLRATKDGVPICPLGWTQGINAYATGGSIIVGGNCVGDHIQMEFGPTPSPGGSAPCLWILQKAFPDGQCPSLELLSGQATVTGSTGSFRVAGNCSCDPYSAEFSLPLSVL